jgi:hypothetical protein
MQVDAGARGCRLHVPAVDGGTVNATSTSPVQSRRHALLPAPPWRARPRPAETSTSRDDDMHASVSWKHVLGAALLFAGAAVLDARADPIPVLPAGPHAVGCSNMTQDFTRIPLDDVAQDYWEGKPKGNATRYVTDLFTNPANAFVLDLAVPDDGGLFGAWAARTVPFAALVCYPTSALNTRPDYALPTGNVVPHMQRGGEAPIFASDGDRYPVLLFSHGLSGSPLSGDYIEA